MLLVVTTAPMPAHAEGWAGRYQLVGMREAAGGLEIGEDGHFRYGFSYGALDEGAEGDWREDSGRLCLTTRPRPVPPAFSQAETGEQEATVFVTWPNGRGIAGIDVIVGFDSGDPIAGYTQVYGWSLPNDEDRAPRWIELSEPIHRIGPTRFSIDAGARAQIRAVLHPNDLGVVDFAGTCLERKGNQLVMRRDEGELRFARIAAEEMTPSP